MATAPTTKVPGARRAPVDGYLIGTACLILTAMAGCGIGGQSPFSNANPSGSAQCSISNASYLARPSQFEQITSLTMNELPQKGGESGEPISGFEGGRLLGFINGVALQEPYISDERARASNLGYTVGKWPPVPLEGEVVKATPGILELYQGHYSFGTPAMARAWASHFVSSMRLDPRASAVGSFLPAGFAVFETTLGPNDGLHEHAVEAFGVVGLTTLQLSIQGGDGVTSKGERAVMEAAVSQLQTSCSITGDGH